MPRTASPIFTCTGTPIWGEFLITEEECPRQALSSHVSGLYDAWDDIAFWRSISSYVMWNPSRTDAPPEFRREIKPSGGLFYPGDNHIAVNINLESVQLEGHELGHAFEKFYGIQTDTACRLFVPWCNNSGLTDVELRASGIGNVILTRAKIPNTPAPVPGLLQMMVAVRSIRN